MFATISKKTAAFLLAVFVISGSVFNVSCQKEISGGDGFIVTETPPDLTSKVNSSVTGFVTDENNAAVNGATVKVGTATVTTDKYGYFEVRNVEVVKNAAVITAIKPGYFKGIKTYFAAAGKSAFFRIKLIPKNIAGNFDAAAGGTVTPPGGLSISFPANAIVVAASGTAYTGPVSVAAQWLNPTATDLPLTMPGNLMGLDSLGFLRTLTTYGMAAVELTGGSGELLQIAPGKKATITFPIPATIASSAPTSLPLWSFDEANGLWKQEGFATKAGGNYVGDVSHFSFWNCDVPANFVQFNCTVRDATGNPVPGAVVKVSVVGNPQNAGYGWTDSSGYTGGAVPNNSQLLLEVFSNYACGTAAYSQNFATTNQNVSLGDIIIPAASIATVSGSVINCNAAPVTNGYVVMVKDGMYSRYPVSNTGTFSFTTTLCSNNTNVTLVAEDIATLQAGNEQTETLTVGSNAVGTLTACGTSIEQFINYTVNGTAYPLAYPADSITHSVYTQNNPPISLINGSHRGSGTAYEVSFGFTQNGIVAGGTQLLNRFRATQIPDSNAELTGNPLVNITEYGNVGGFIAGNFTCTVTAGSPPGTPYNVTCNFKVRRRQ